MAALGAALVRSRETRPRKGSVPEEDRFAALAQALPFRFLDF
jgi:hypothetical protein